MAVKQNMDERQISHQMDMSAKNLKSIFEPTNNFQTLRFFEKVKTFIEMLKL